MTCRPQPAFIAAAPMQARHARPYAGQSATLALMCLMALPCVSLLIASIPPANAQTKALTQGEIRIVPPFPMPHPHRASRARKAAFAAMKVQNGQASAPEPRNNFVNAGTPGKSGTVEKAAPQIERDDTATQSPAEAPPTAWSMEEIRAAEVSCDTQLQAVTARSERLEPIRHGQCGTPVPLKLEAVGVGAPVTISPPATANCALTARLYNWLETVARPAARATLGSDIVALRNASSYICRNRYSDPAQKISEHAFANALDISSFKLADGREIDVKRYWGKVVESELAARKLVSLPAPETRPANLSTTKATASGKAEQARTLASSEPQPPAASAVTTPELTFLRDIHSGACGIFTTVLGPNANAAHHDHIHLDLKGRRSSAYCE